jgi:DNA-directed RNA polymerase subunit RPC12/RpoP
VIGHGISWRCKECGREWVKTPHPHHSIVRPDHPCPDCGSMCIISKGSSWKCSKCGRQFSKNLRKVEPFINYVGIPLRVRKVKEI